MAADGPAEAPGANVWPGRPFPLGATWDGEGTNFSVFSENAERVELCLFDADGTERRFELTQRTAFNWHGYLDGVGPGQRYGFRVHGPYAPEHGHRFNAAKLLLDPYAKVIDGGVRWDAGNAHPYVPGEDDAVPDLTDDAAAMPRCVVIDPGFDWEGDRQLQTPWHETVIYELHVRGFTKLHPGVREDLRGTYAGLASDEAIAYLKELGVTAVELLPVHHIIDESFLHERGLTNYWGYSSIGFLAPHAGYAATGVQGEQIKEFKGMVKALHRAGIEVILDVVYNHTAEGNHLGPMLSFKGIDNASYYRLMPDDPSRYMDFTGTGNSLNPVHPSVLRLIMDSLRYWVTECHVDGFRFDLASALARELYDVDRLSAFFDVIHQDPVLSQVKLIAEPWDLGPGGYQVGNFPVLWTEWNGMYRDTMRDLWRGDATVAEFASRFTGSSDLYESDGRHPSASINFVTAHDGFTLADLVSYNDKHNEANGEDNQDGTDDNRSWNCGAEGPTDDPEVNALRERQQRNFLATLLLSQGVPMITAGDEIGRTQGGNNNAWCQDNEISWIDWELDARAHGAARVHAPPAERCAASIRSSTARSSSTARARPRRPARRLVVPSRRPAHDGGQLERRQRALARRLPERPRARQRRRAGRADRRPLVRAAAERAPRGHRVHAAAAPLRPALAGRALDRLSGCARHAADRARLRARDRALAAAAAPARRTRPAERSPVPSRLKCGGGAHGKTVVLVGTLDTKGREYAFLRDRLHAAGVGTLLVDAGIMGPPLVEPDVSREDVAEAAGADVEALRAAGDRGQAVLTMARGATADRHAAARRGALRRRARRGRLGQHVDRGRGHAGAAGRRAQADRLDDRRRRHAPDRRRERHAAGGLGRRRGGHQLGLGAHPRERRGRHGRNGAGGAARAGGEPAADRRLDVRRDDALRDARGRGAGRARLRGAHVPHDGHGRAARWRR